MVNEFHELLYASFDTMHFSRKDVTAATSRMTALTANTIGRIASDCYFTAGGAGNFSMVYVRGKDIVFRAGTWGTFGEELLDVILDGLTFLGVGRETFCQLPGEEIACIHQSSIARAFRDRLWALYWGCQRSGRTDFVDALTLGMSDDRKRLIRLRRRFGPVNRYLGVVSLLASLVSYVVGGASSFTGALFVVGTSATAMSLLLSRDSVPRVVRKIWDFLEAMLGPLAKLVEYVAETPHATA